MKKLLPITTLLILIGAGCVQSKEAKLVVNEELDNATLLSDDNQDDDLPDQIEDICDYKGTALDANESYDDGCNTYTCQLDGTILSTEKACDEPENDYSVSGTVMVSGFSGTEKGCEFGDNASVGDRIKCNDGSVTLFVQSGGDTFVWLDGYRCDAVEYLVKESDGYSVEYETTDCTAEIVVGNQYTFYGTSQERNGMTWLLNAVAGSLVSR